MKKSECALSCWLVFPAARKRRESMCSVVLAGLSCCWSVGKREEKAGQVYPARKACVEEGERMLPRLFIVARGSDPGRMA